MRKILWIVPMLLVFTILMTCYPAIKYHLFEWNVYPFKRKIIKDSIVNIKREQSRDSVQLTVKVLTYYNYPYSSSKWNMVVVPDTACIVYYTNEYGDTTSFEYYGDSIVDGKSVLLTIRKSIHK